MPAAPVAPFQALAGHCGPLPPFPVPLGLIARQYEALGGRTEYRGKPYPEVYAACFTALGEAAGGREVDRARVCGVGDSLEHDVQGAHVNGIGSVFTANGVHCAALGTEEGSPVLPEADRLQALYGKYGVQPQHVMPGFRW